MRDAENYIIPKLGVETFTEISAELGVRVQTIANRAKEFGEVERELQLKGRYRYLSTYEVFITRDQESEAVYYWLLNDNSRSWKSNNIRLLRTYPLQWCQNVYNYAYIREK